MFERLLAALTDNNLPAMADAALRFAYYWCAVRLCGMVAEVDAALRFVCCCHPALRCAALRCAGAAADWHGPALAASARRQLRQPSRAPPRTQRLRQPTLALPDKPPALLTTLSAPPQVQLHAAGPRLCLLRLRLHAGRLPGRRGACARHHAQAAPGAPAPRSSSSGGGGTAAAPPGFGRSAPGRAPAGAHVQRWRRAGQGTLAAAQQPRCRQPHQQQQSYPGNALSALTCPSRGRPPPLA